jgi:hypothetical protein
MKSIFFFLAIMVSLTANSQTYTEMNVPNSLPMSEMVIEISANEAFHILNKQVGAVTITYILINKTSTTYTAPTLPPGFSAVTLYKANASSLKFAVGSTIPIIIDNNGCSYMRIH